MTDMKNIPHKGFINVRVTRYVHQLETSGRVQGTPIQSTQDSFLFELDGKTEEECKENTDKLLEEIKEFINGKQPKVQSKQGPTTGYGGGNFQSEVRRTAVRQKSE